MTETPTPDFFTGKRFDPDQGWIEQHRCTECDATYSTFDAAARCHPGIGGVEPRPNREREYACVVVDRYTGRAREVRVLATSVADAASRVNAIKTADEHIDSISE